MKCSQYLFCDGAWASTIVPNVSAQWVWVFGDRDLERSPEIQSLLQSSFPNAERVGCSTSGEIAGDQVYDKSLVVTVIEFEKTQFKCTHLNLEKNSFKSEHEVGVSLANSIPQEDLKYALLIANGHSMNATGVIEGIRSVFPEGVILTGGLAGDDARFEETMVWHNNECSSELVVLCGVYGDSIQVGHGSLGGWRPFGPSRKITKANNNVLYELDDTNALALYKTYLGDYANELPASALLFPLAMSEVEEGDAVVRTIISIDETEQTMTFAGDMPEGFYTRLMRANFEGLIDGAQAAAEQSLKHLNKKTPDLALLISCVGRRLVLNQRVEEELEEVTEIVGSRCVTAGFYSYGEIAPMHNTADCKLHNQTMTITTFTER